MVSGEIDAQVTAYSCRQCESFALDRTGHQCCGEKMEPVAVDAVNEPELSTLLPQVFGISQTGVDILVQIMDREEVATDDIATALELNRSTVSRQLTQLRELGVVECRKQSLKGGGKRTYTRRSPRRRCADATARA